MRAEPTFSLIFGWVATDGRAVELGGPGERQATRGCDADKRAVGAIEITVGALEDEQGDGFRGGIFAYDPSGVILVAGRFGEGVGAALALELWWGDGAVIASFSIPGLLSCVISILHRIRRKTRLVF